MSSDDRPERKKRNLLKDYYGTNDAPPIVERLVESNLDRRPDPLDLDISAFNPQLYLNKYLYEVSLQDLIRRDNDLVTEIKELDGDMKTLVYENYSKFISATDTIKNMKSKVESMEQKVKSLSVNINAISTLYQEVNESLTERRQKIHQLGGVHVLLKKLNFVFELPTKLQECLNKQRLQQAVKYYSSTVALLDNYGHLTMFKKISEESKLIIKVVARKVDEKLNLNQSTMEEIFGCINMLIGLGNHSPEALSKLFISTIEPRFKKSLEDAENDSKSINGKITESIAKLNQSILLNISKFVDYYLRFFKSTSTANNLLSDNSNSIEYSSHSARSSDDTNSIKTYFSLKITDEERNSSLFEMEAFTREILTRYFNLINQILTIPDANLQSALFQHQQLQSPTKTTSKVEIKSYLNGVALVVGILDDKEPLNSCYQQLISFTNFKVECLNVENGWYGQTTKNIFRIVLDSFFAKFDLLFVEKDNFVNAKKAIINDEEDDFGEVGKELGRNMDSLLKWLEEVLVEKVLPIFQRFLELEGFQENEESPKPSLLKTEEVLFKIKTEMLEFWRLFSVISKEKFHQKNSRLEESKTQKSTTTNSTTRKNSTKFIHITKAVKCLLLSRFLLELSGHGLIEQIHHKYVNGLFSPQNKEMAKNPSTDGSSSTKKNGLMRGSVLERERSGASFSSKKKTTYFGEGVVVHEFVLRGREISENIKLLSQGLLRNFIGIVTTEFTNSIRHFYLENDYTECYSTEPEPPQKKDDESLSEIWVGIFSDLERLEKSIDGLYPDDGKLAAKRRKISLDKNAPSTTKRGPSFALNSLKKGGPEDAPGKFDNLLSNIGKLFADKIEIFTEVELHSGSILTSIVKITLKCFVETIRLLTLNQNGLKKIKSDTALLKSAATQYSLQDDVIFSLLDEVIVSANRRCQIDIIVTTLDGEKSIQI